MDFQQTLNYLYNKLPMFSRMGSSAFKKDLTNTRLLCEHLGNPHNQFKSVHIGGTNGKGSVSHMLAAVFQEAGYKTGLYTSPHLYDFRERIRVNGEMVSEEYVIEFVEQIQPVIEKIEPSFFEITVAMAFDYFARQKVDIAVIEVGLGGRLDSTNIITPELSVITNIGWDHMNMLGDNLEQIAFEKAGIIKEKIPVVIGEALAETKPVFEKAASEKAAPLVFAEEQWIEISHHVTNDYLHARYKKGEKEAAVQTDLPGIYQVKNIRSVLTAIDCLNDLNWKLDKEIVSAALRNVKQLTGLMGRWEVIHHDPMVVLEVAHNRNGIEQMLQHISHLQYHHLHIIFGMVKDKDADHILCLLPSHASYYFTQAHIPRALPVNDLATAAAKNYLKGKSFEDVNIALKAALKNAGKNDLILICGSIFLVAEVNRQFLAERN